MSFRKTIMIAAAASAFLAPAAFAQNANSGATQGEPPASSDHAMKPMDGMKNGRSMSAPSKGSSVTPNPSSNDTKTGGPSGGAPDRS